MKGLATKMSELINTNSTSCEVINIKNNSSSSDSDRPILCFALQFGFFVVSFIVSFIKVSLK